MPELPEVQTVINDLNKKIKGDIIADFWSDWPKAIKDANNGKSASSADKFQKEIKGRKILGARRLGKNIFIDLSGGKTLYIHLKMTGHLLVKSAITNHQDTRNKDYFSDRVNQYIHHIWYLADAKQRMKSKSTKSTKSTKNTNDKFVDSHNFVGSNRTLEFSDVRKFAKIVLDDTEKINNLPEIKKLGVDAMSPQFTFKKFTEILERKKHKAIGLILMEQELIAGIGNIYRSEILYESGILPTRKIESLSQEEKKKIFKNIQKVLKKAIKYRGTSDSDYRDTAGAPGSFQKVMKVYNKKGKKCPKCDTIINRMTLGQRSAFYCSQCQK